MNTWLNGDFFFQPSALEGVFGWFFGIAIGIIGDQVASNPPRSCSCEAPWLQHPCLGHLGDYNELPLEHEKFPIINP